MTSAPRGWTKLQSRLLAEVRCFDKQALRPSPTRITGVCGTSIIECRKERDKAQEEEEEERQRVEKALQKLALARQHKDKYPCKVADGLYIGAAGAARNLKALQKAGVTHVLNASPAVPCYFREHGSLAYLALDLFDDPGADLLAHVEAANAFMDAARAAGGAVLVHCYAGQSRSVALVMAYLMAHEGRDMVSAWAMVRRARPCAKPNSGFLRQLARYGAELGREGAFEVA